MKSTIYSIAFILCLCHFISCKTTMLTPIISIPKSETYSMDFTGPMTSEINDTNPFTDYRLTVKFSHAEEKITVLGYYAADGNAAESSADSGSVWRINFVPPKVGKWKYKVSCRKGKNIVIDENPLAGEPDFFDGFSGVLEVYEKDQPSSISKNGRLQYVGERYLKFAATGKYFLKAGPNSPENFLAYEGFDGTYAYDSTKNFIKKYEPHLKDWKTGDPTWQGDKGKGIIGALNYISSLGMNTVYFLTMNIGGDGRDVWPYISHNDFTRFDCSKLDQWNIVFQHAQKLGIMLHFVLQETENELLLDNGNTEFHRKLYYRELIARFSHHPMITWNLGEENGPANFSPEGQNDKQRKAMASYIKSIDPYKNFLVIHTHSWAEARDPIVKPLLGFEKIDGLSLQIDKKKMVHDETLKYINQSKKAGRNWVSSMDEIGMYWMGAMPDAQNPDHDTLRQEVLWGHLMAGGAGVEWYFGYKFPPADLDCEDWRSRDNLWKQSKIAIDFFQNYLPFWKMENHDELIDVGHGYCFALPDEVYAIYLKKPSKVKLMLKNVGEYSVQWFNPKEGGSLKNGSISEISGSGWKDLGKPINDIEKDQVILIKRK